MQAQPTRTLKAIPGDRLPPHNLQAEESLLGAMLLSRDAIGPAVEVCSSDDFYKPAHAHIFEAIISLWGRGEPADPVTVADELKRADLLEVIGDPGYLYQLQIDTPATSNAGRYAQIVSDHAISRKMISVANAISEKAYGMPENVTEMVDEAESMVFDVGQRRVTNTMAPLRDLLSQSLNRLEEMYDRNDEVIGVPTGFVELDKRLLGFQPGQFIVVGARPAIGKTSWALNAASHAAQQGVPVLFFSLEMGSVEVTQRLLCAEARVDATRLRNGSLHDTDWPKVNKAIGILGEAPIFIDDNPSCSVMDIRAKARRLKASPSGLGLVVIDYIQLMTGRANAENRQVQVSEMSRSLKILARELETPVVALAQLSRGVEARVDKRPMLSDLKESGCLPASTRILRADNGEEVTIGELVLSQEQPLVWSVGENQRLVSAKVEKVFATGIKPVFNLRLASGRTVEATGNHPFLTIDGWTALDRLKLGDFVAVPRVEHRPFGEPSRTWSDDELILLAHMSGDGSMGPQFKYTTADPANKQIVEEVAYGLFGIEAKSDKVGNTWQMWLPSPHRLTHNTYHPMRSWLEPLGLWKSRSWTKFVPQSIFGLSDDQIALFLRHLWATDGSITIGRNNRGPIVSTYYASTSRQLALDVQRLLLRFGIRSRIGKAKKLRIGNPKDGVQHYRPGYNVRIQGAANQALFLRRVGCYGQRGEVIPEALSILDCIKENPNVDLVPWEISFSVREAAEISGVTLRDIATGLGETYCHSYLLGNETRRRRFSRKRLETIAEIVGSEKLRDVATSDLYWDEVVEITPLGDKPTWDLTIAGTHNFIADQIVVHNSLEQDSDVVMFLYRDEVYNPETPDRGTAEVTVAKNRHGPTGTTTLAFIDRYTRFANMARV